MLMCCVCVCRGYGYVEYKTMTMAETARLLLNDINLRGSMLLVCLVSITGHIYSLPSMLS